MLDAKGKYRCDAEIGKPGNWHGCLRPAKQQIHSETGILHYCNAHARFGLDKFKPAPFAAFRPITE